MTESARLEELARAAREYETRDSDPSYEERWSELDPHVHLVSESRERAFLGLLKSRGIKLGGTKFLDVGCGKGSQLNRLLAYGARPECLAGMDLSETRIEAASSRLPSAVRLRAGSADAMPFEDASFDVILQYTLMSSVLDESVREGIASEMLRVLSPSGIIVWYDMQRDSMVARRRWREISAVPIHWFTAAEVRDLFGDCESTVRSVTLAPWIGVRVLPRSLASYQLLEHFPALHSHHLIAITRRDR